MGIHSRYQALKMNGLRWLKTRDDLPDFIDRVAGVGVQSFAIHARMAWLEGLSPKENRNIPPLRYAEESAECMVAQVLAGMPINLLSAGQAGATSPAALAGSLAQALHLLPQVLEGIGAAER